MVDNITAGGTCPTRRTIASEPIDSRGADSPIVAGLKGAVVDNFTQVSVGADRTMTLEFTGKVYAQTTILTGQGITFIIINTFANLSSPFAIFGAHSGVTYSNPFQAVPIRGRGVVVPDDFSILARGGDTG